MSGVVVALANGPEELEAARRAMADFENVMFIDARPDQIPWREQYFTKVFVPPHLQALLPHIQGELHRVLAPEGQILSTAANG
jgi:ubiquinone/menaquinone biosynthesis C-methylase UbiE